MPAERPPSRCESLLHDVHSEFHSNHEHVGGQTELRDGEKTLHSSRSFPREELRLTPAARATRTATARATRPPASPPPPAAARTARDAPTTRQNTRMTAICKKKWTASSRLVMRAGGQGSHQHHAGAGGIHITMKDAPREGFHSITPRIVVSDAAAQVAFRAPSSTPRASKHAGRPAEIRIGDSLVWHQRMRLAVKGAI